MRFEFWSSRDNTPIFARTVSEAAAQAVILADEFDSDGTLRDARGDLVATIKREPTAMNGFIALSPGA